MSLNRRIFYAVQKAAIAPPGSLSFETIHGLQTLGITTTFNLDQVFEIGQLSVYENIEGIPDVEVTMEKVLDGWPPVYMLATQADASQGATTSPTLTGRSTASCNVGVGIYADTQDQADSGTPEAEVHMSGMYVSSVGYNATVDGSITESVTLVGNDKIWVGVNNESAGTYDDGTHWDGSSSLSNNTDQPYAISGSGGVNRREDVLLGDGNTLGGENVSWLPTDIPFLDIGLGSPSGFNVLDANGNYYVHLQSWNISTDLGREELFELGRRGNYFRFVSFPVEVTNDITVISTSGDFVSAAANGLYTEGTCGRYNLLDKTIIFRTCEGLEVNCGNNNKLSSVNQTGGDAGGGNVEVTYSYTNFNDFIVTHPQDPAGL
jgi:hypothetical protein